MTTTSRRCPICKSDTAPARVVSTSGADSSLEVTVKGMPVLECTQGHRLFALADFPLLLLDHLLEHRPLADQGDELLRHALARDRP